MTHLTILHTNDVHGRVQQLARIATLAKQIRREVAAQGGYCALWDAGDVEDPTLFESSMTKGSAAMSILRSAGYELEALGNASIIRYGPQCVPALADNFGQPLLCANMLDTRSQLIAGLAPYSIQTFGDVTLGIIGLTDPMRFYPIFGLKPLEPTQVLPQLIVEVRSHGAQTIVLLSHLSSKRDQTVAEQVDGLDLIIGAHDHVELYPPLTVGQTLIAQAGDLGRWLGRLDLEIDSATGRIVNHRGKLLPISEDIPTDPAVEAAYQAEREKVQQMTRRVIGELHDPIDLAYDRECAAGNLLADALRERLQAEIGLVLAGQWTAGLRVGPLTLGTLVNANHSAANPAKARLTGRQIVEFLEEGFKPDNMARMPKPLRGAPGGLQHVSGLKVQYGPN